jgi:hypothetical protein
MEKPLKQWILHSYGQNPGIVRSAAAYSNRQHAITFDRAPLRAIGGNIASRAGRVNLHDLASLGHRGQEHKGSR